MKTCRKGLHQYEGKRCLECKAEGIRAWTAKNRTKWLEYQRAWDAENRPKKAEQRRARKYGLAPGGRDAMFAAQGYMCANQRCKATEPGNKWGWSMDHDHVTGKVRGLLCHYCNVSLGALKESAERALGLLDYMNFHATIGHYRYFAAEAELASQPKKLKPSKLST